MRSYPPWWHLAGQHNLKCDTGFIQQFFTNAYSTSPRLSPHTSSSFRFLLRIRDFTLELRLIQLFGCSSLTANHVSWWLGTNANTANYRNKTSHDGSCQVYYTRPSHPPKRHLWDVVWICDFNTCKTEWDIKLEIPVLLYWTHDIYCISTHRMPLAQSKCLIGSWTDLHNPMRGTPWRSLASCHFSV